MVNISCSLLTILLQQKLCKKLSGMNVLCKHLLQLTLHNTYCNKNIARMFVLGVTLWNVSGKTRIKKIAQYKKGLAIHSLLRSRY